MVRNASALQRRPGLGGAHPSRFCQPWDVDNRLEADVRGLRRHRPGGCFDDQIRRPKTRLQKERVVVRPLPRRRHILRASHRSPGIDPAHDEVDLFVGQRRVVDEFLDADRLVEGPGRHLAPGDACLDRSNPGPRILVGLQRHRPDASGPMAGFTLRLENRRDVFRKCDGARFPACRLTSERWPHTQHPDACEQ